MADRLKDEQDLALEALFRMQPVADDGFSKQVTTVLRRRIWARRIALPFAVFVGSAIAAKPAVVLLGRANELLASMPGVASSWPVDWVPSTYTLLAGGVLLAVGLFGLNVLEE
ncbi:MAG: hypothetical protein AAFX56_03555 [Pseudomonadota bacterium]